MSIIKAFREESEVIKFDNLFTRDLEDEQQFDLVFAAEQDDEDLKTIAGNKIMRENGEEKVFDLPDCIYVNEDGEVKDKDDEVEDISSNDADDDGVDDDIEAAEVNPTAAAPSVVVNVDADDVNINAGNGGTSFEGSDEEVKEDASVTVNAKVVNMTTNVDPGNKEDEVPAPSTEPAAAPVPAEAPSDDEPIEPVGDVEVDIETEPSEPESSEADVEECGDNCRSTPGTDDNGVPMGEGVEQIMTSSQLEDVLNNGLGVAPAYEGGQFINIPEDKSTEVVFANSNDKEVREATEPTTDPARDIIKEEDDGKEADEEVSTSAEADDKNEPQNEAKEPTTDPAIDLIKEEDIDICCDPTEGEPPCADCQGKAAPVPAPSKDSSSYNPYGKEPIEDKEDGMKTIDDLDMDIQKFDEAESMDPKEDIVQADAETSLEGIGPGLTSGNLEKMYVDKDVDPNRKNSARIEESTIAPIGDIEDILEAKEPTTDPATDVVKEYSLDPMDYVKEFMEAKEPTTDPATDVLTEAHFSFWPKFKDSEELKKYSDVAKEAEDILNSNGEASKVLVQRIFKVALKILRILNDIETTITGAMSIFIAPIIPHLIFRGINYAIQIGEEAFAKSEANSIKNQLLEVAKNTKDPKAKAEIKKAVEKINSKLNSISEASEPTTDPARDVVKEEIEAVKNDDNLENSKKIEGEFEDDIDLVTDADVEKIINSAPEDEVKKEVGQSTVKPSDVPMNDGSAHEAAEPTSDPSVKPVKEEIEAVKNDDNLENAKKIEGDFEDDLDPITDGDMEKLLNAAPEDETKKEVGQDPVKPSDVPMNDGSAHEAAEPTTDPPIEFIKEEDTEILSSDDIDMDNNCDISPVGPTKVIPDEVNAPKEDIDYDKEAAPMREADFMDQVNALDNGDNFADTMNTGINIAPEEIIPGSDEELIDDEAIAFIEGE